MLSVHGINKRFGGFTAVDGVSLEVARGETVALLGVNGAGKTTLMNMILGLIIRVDAHQEVELRMRPVSWYCPAGWVVEVVV